MAIGPAVTREDLAIAYGNGAAFVSLHTADPGTTGANEVSGGGYARVALTWTPGPVDGQVTASATVTVAAGVAITHVGLWPSVSGGTFRDKAAAAATSTGSVAVSLTFTEV